jgi:hypothetical protein
MDRSILIQKYFSSMKSPQGNFDKAGAVQISASVGLFFGIHRPADG